MEYRKLGDSSLEVSAVCLGTMTWGRQNTEADAFAQLDLAAERGINFLDTAESYPVPAHADYSGRTEEIIGTWMKERGNRDRVVIATKVAGRTSRTWLRDPARPTELTREQIFAAVEGSLRRLGTDYIDLYQCHEPDRAVAQYGNNPTVFRPADGPENPISETAEALGELVKAGKIREIGICNESAWGAMQYLKEAAAKGRPRIRSIQNAYNLLNRTFETSLAEFVLRERLAHLAYSPLAMGYLTGKYEDGAAPQGSRKALFPLLGRYETPGAGKALAAYLKLARELGLEPARMALAFVMSRPFVTSTIVGATSTEQLAANIDAFDLDIPGEIEERINAVHLLNTNPCP